MRTQDKTRFSLQKRLKKRGKMPLFNGTEFAIAPIPTQIQDETVFYIPFTGEIFTNYE
jgi:hypothetical protein